MSIKPYKNKQEAPVKKARTKPSDKPQRNRKNK